MRAVGRAEVHARSVGAVRERELAEVPGYQGVGEIVATDRAPAGEVLGGHEDAPVAALPAAGPASEAVEIGRCAHRPGSTTGDRAAPRRAASQPFLPIA